MPKTTTKPRTTAGLIHHAANACAAAALLAGTAGIASADSVVLTIDPAQSFIDVDATLIAPVGDQTQSASTSISGTIEIELDDYGTPTAISLVDFIIVLDNDITLNYSYGFLGNANATLAGASAMYGTPGTPTGPEAVVSSEFFFPAVSSALAGAANGSYSFLLVGSDTIAIDLGTLPLFDAPIAGSVAVNGSDVEFFGDYSFDVVQELVAGVADLRLVGSAIIVASGTAPEPAGCNDADLAVPFGVLDLADISGFVAAFLAQDQAADIAAPFGVWDLTDLSTFIGEFLAGCP